MSNSWCAGAVAVWMAGTGVAWAQPQVELDRIVARVGARVITKSDLHQAMMLRLVDDVSSEQAVQRCLEERWLILDEIGKGAPLPPHSESDLASHRAAWERRVGGAGAVPGLLSKAGLNDAALQAWLRDDLRIQAYVDRQFATVSSADRPKAREEWIGRLRPRARK